ncbi:MAG: hypothetical protein LBO65_07075 [Spirochaetaceae bacterium]|nr:hypothetical protein [Spirochaetaceae bacterium]
MRLVTSIFEFWVTEELEFMVRPFAVTEPSAEVGFVIVTAPELTAKVPPAIVLPAVPPMLNDPLTVKLPVVKMPPLEFTIVDPLTVKVPTFRELPWRLRIIPLISSEVNACPRDPVNVIVSLPLGMVTVSPVFAPGYEEVGGEDDHCVVSVQLPLPDPVHV